MRDNDSTQGVIARQFGAEVIRDTGPELVSINILLSVASGFLAFFATCFLAIIALLCWNLVGHNHVNYADSYKYISFPAGCVVLAMSLIFFGTLWLRRKFSRG